jgi:hypothetical protein
MPSNKNGSTNRHIESLRVVGKAVKRSASASKRDVTCSLKPGLPLCRCGDRLRPRWPLHSRPTEMSSRVNSSQEWQEISSEDAAPRTPTRKRKVVITKRKGSTVSSTRSPKPASRATSDVELPEPIVPRLPKSNPVTVRTSALDQAAAFTFNLLFKALKLLFTWSLALLSLLLSHLLAAGIGVGLVVVLTWYLWTFVPSLHLSGLTILRPALYSIPTLYCSTVGIGCGPRKPSIAKLARTTADQANQAHDIFQSLISLGDPKTHTLAFTEIWELAVAVKVSSDLPMREEFGEALKELGDQTRDVSDSLVECVLPLRLLVNG